MVKAPRTIIATTTGRSTAESGNSIVRNFKLKLRSSIKSFSFVATAISTPGCEYQFGIYEDSAECSTSYIKCEYGVPHQLPCTKGLVYDERIHGCNWPDMLLEKCNPEAVIGFKCPSKVDPHSLAARFWPFPRFAVPGDRHSLFLCNEGHPRLIACGEDKLFDESTLTCEDAE